jgi:hypothetical protein
MQKGYTVLKTDDTKNDKLVVLGNLAFLQREIRGIRAGHDDDEVYVITEYGEYLALGITFTQAIMQWANGGA